MDQKTKVALLLSLLSPFFAEVLSGSTPPLEIINPLSFIFLWAFYGGGVLLVRELWIRWGRGYLRLMLLGFLYGVVEEGLIVKSWFDPNWPDLDVLGVYGRVWGVNTVWAVWLTIFHSLMSITMPILVIEALYPEYRNKALIGKRGLEVACFSFLTSALLMFFFLNPYKPPFLQYILTIMLIFGLFLLANHIKRESMIKSKTALKHPFIYGFMTSSLLFFIYTALPHSSIPPIISIILGIAVASHFYSQLVYLNDLKLFSTTLGLLAFWFIPYDIILEFNGVFGESVLGIITFLFLLKKWDSKRRSSCHLL